MDTCNDAVLKLSRTGLAEWLFNLSEILQRYRLSFRFTVGKASTELLSIEFHVYFRASVASPAKGLLLPSVDASVRTMCDAERLVSRKSDFVRDMR